MTEAELRADFWASWLVALEALRARPSTLDQEKTLCQNKALEPSLE